MLRTDYNCQVACDLWSLSTSNLKPNAETTADKTQAEGSSTAAHVMGSGSPCALPRPCPWSEQGLWLTVNVYIVSQLPTQLLHPLHCVSGNYQSSVIDLAF